MSYLEDAGALAPCKQCLAATRSVPCELCPGLTCAVCGRCPACDGDLPEEGQSRMPSPIYSDLPDQLD